MLPSGPLREPFGRTLGRAHALVAVAPFADGAGAPLGAPPSEAALRGALALPPHVPLLRAALRPAEAARAALAGRRVVAFAGTARPRRFFATLEALGCQLPHVCALPDHAPLPPPLLRRLRAAAQDHGALLATTAKDAARLSAAEREGLRLHVLPMELHWQPEAEERLDVLLEPLLARAASTVAREPSRDEG